MTHMLRFLIFLFLGVYAYLTSNEKSNFSRHPVILVRTGFPREAVQQASEALIT